jgi:hypothetical protein
MEEREAEAGNVSSFEKPSEQEKKKTIYSGTELLRRGRTEVPKLVDPLFIKKGVVGITGATDCGKSTFCRQLTMAVAQRKTSFLGYPLNCRFGRAIYISTEDDDESVAAQLHKQAGNLEHDELQNLYFFFESNDLLNELDKFLSVKRVDLIVLDTWSDTYEGNPNNWVEVRKSISALKALALKYECLVLIVHHNVKNSEKSLPDKNKLNGSQAIEAKLRCLLELRKGSSPNERHLYVLKHNYMSAEQKAEGMVLELNSERLLFTNTGRRTPVSGDTGDVGSKQYDPAVWIPRMAGLKSAGLSYENGRKQLEMNHPDEIVPGLTWFKNKREEIEAVSQSLS